VTGAPGPPGPIPPPWLDPGETFSDMENHMNIASHLGPRPSLSYTPYMRDPCKPELKCLVANVGYAQAAIPALTPQIATMGPLIALGNTASSRIGRKITLKSITVKLGFYPGSIQSSTVFTLYVGTVYWALILDTQCNGAAPVIGDIYDTSALTNISYCTRNRNNMKRFQILKEGVFEPNITRDSVYSTGTSTMYNWYTGIPEKQAWYSKFETPFYYKGNAGTVADMASNALFFVYHADSFFNTTASYPIANSALQGQVCMCYTDE